LSDVTRYEAFTPTEISAGKIEVVIERHASEAAFLWLLRDAAVRAPHYKLKDLAKLDERVEAHLDGLRVAGDTGWDILVKQLEATPEPGETFAGGVLAAESGLPARIDPVVKAATASPMNARALASAFGWLPPSLAIEQTKTWLVSNASTLRRIAIAVAAIHRRDPGPPLQQLLDDNEPDVRARALRAVGELGTGSYLPQVRKNFNHAHPACRFWACWSAARMGDKSAIGELQVITQAGPELRAQALNMAVRLLDPAKTLRWLEILGQLPGAERLALQGYGWFGDAMAAFRLLSAMKTPALARRAGEAFTFITGIDLAYDDLETDKPEGFEAGPTEDPADENVAMDPDDNLPWPDVDKITKWWEKNRSNFPVGKRLLLGKPITPEWCREVLKIGKQRQRAAAALELALKEPGKPLFEVRAPGFRQ
jgi:uncharacterized protein (TIGR02270 family)